MLGYTPPGRRITHTPSTMKTRIALFALALSLPLAACGDDVVDDGVEADATEFGNEVEAGATEVGNDIEAGATELGNEVEAGAMEAGETMEMEAMEADNEMEEALDGDDTM